MLPRYLNYLVMLAFLSINSFTTYYFYHVNSSKLVAILGSLFLILPVLYYHYPKFHFRQSTLWSGLFALSPVILTFPGLLHSMGKTNYNFAYELSALAMLGCWLMIIRELFQKEESLDIFFKVLLFLIAGVFIHSIFQAVQLKGDLVSIKSTFGNRNYFTGFLIQIFPLLFSIGFLNKNQKSYFKIPTWVYLSGAGLILIVIFMIQSRAGMGSSLAVGFLIVFARLFFNTSKNNQKKIIWSFASIAFIGIIAYLSIFIFK